VQPHPTDHLGLLRVPGPALSALSVRFAPLADRDQFNPASWAQHPLAKSGTFAGWWEIDLDLLALNDGEYEYEFVVNGTTSAADPYAEEITRFGGYRGLFTIAAASGCGSPFAGMMSSHQE
jgi:hypothetical protein